jgi:NAD(P)-dependent dehydrogenase (short-subunit alcohol dehydrogenase family)
MVDESVSSLGQLNIAVSNAGIITEPARFHEMSPEEWNKVISANLTGVFLCMQKEIEVMLKKQMGVASLLVIEAIWAMHHEIFFVDN